MTWKDNLDRAFTTRSAADSEAQDVRNNSDLSQTGRLRALAELTAVTNDRLDGLKARYLEGFEADRKEAIERATRVALGHPAGTDEISKRDAMARAAALTSDDEASALMTSALRINDGTLAREIASTAIDRRWPNAVDLYSDAKPSINDSLSLLWQEGATSAMDEAMDRIRWEAGPGSAFAHVQYA